MEATEIPEVNLKSLQYFIAAAQHGSIARAATHLRVAQPAVSRQIRKLEDDLGVRLFARTAQGVTPTEEGRHLLARAVPIVQYLDQARGEVRTLADEPAGPVSVALMPAVGSLVAPQLVRRLRDRHPKVRLHLSEGLSAFIAEGLLEGRFDLGLFHADRDWPLLDVTHLLDEPMFLIGPGGDGTKRRRALDFRDLTDYPLLLPSTPNPLRRMIERLAEDHGVTLDIRESIDSTSVIKGLVLAGLGHTVQCYSYVHEEVSRGELSARPLNMAPLSRNWSLAMLAGRPPVAALSAVAAIIQEIAGELAKTHRWHPGKG